MADGQAKSQFSPLTEFGRRVFKVSRLFSPMTWLSQWLPLLRNRDKLTAEEVNDPSFTRNRARAVEYYLLCWFAIEVVAAGLTCLPSLPGWLRLVFAGIAALRILEIVQVALNTTLFDTLTTRPDEKVALRARILVLAALNYVELLLCFGLIYSADWVSLRGAGQPATAFYLSVMTQLTIGYGDVFPTGWLRLIAATQALTGLLFLILVFGRFIASLPRVHSLLDDEDT